jgi:hypothetical protein
MTTLQEIALVFVGAIVLGIFLVWAGPGFDDGSGKAVSALNEASILEREVCSDMMSTWMSCEVTPVAKRIRVALKPAPIEGQLPMVLPESSQSELAHRSALSITR